MKVLAIGRETARKAADIYKREGIYWENNMAKSFPDDKFVFEQIDRAQRLLTGELIEIKKVHSEAVVSESAILDWSLRQFDPAYYAWAQENISNISLPPFALYVAQRLVNPVLDALVGDIGMQNQIRFEAIQEAKGAFRRASARKSADFPVAECGMATGICQLRYDDYIGRYVDSGFLQDNCLALRLGCLEDFKTIAHARLAEICKPEGGVHWHFILNSQSTNSVAFSDEGTTVLPTPRIIDLARYVVCCLTSRVSDVVRHRECTIIGKETADLIEQERSLRQPFSWYFRTAVTPPSPSS